MIVYTTGYLGERTNRGDGKAKRLAQMVQEIGVILVDIRAVPWSQAPCWRKASLEHLLGESYVHLPALGNLTRRQGLITIADMDAGIGQVLALPKPALLLCCCPDVYDCHRYTVAKELILRPEVTEAREIHHWGPIT